MTEFLLEVRDLKKYFPLKKGFLGHGQGYVRAVDGVSFVLREGDAFGLVGESGSGKSTVARTILRLIEPTGGEVLWNGKNIFQFEEAAMVETRRDLQMIFQDPHSSLNPRMRVGDIVEEPLVIHRIGAKSERRARVAELFELVGLEPAHVLRYPHEFSGGQRQRIGIARALAIDPTVLLMDEPFGALDAQTREDLQAELLTIHERTRKTVLFVTHDLDEAVLLADRVMVMRTGRLHRRRAERPSATSRSP